MSIVLFNSALDAIQARAALKSLPFETMAAIRLDKSHLPAALRAQESSIGTMGARLFSGHNSPYKF